MKRKLFSLLIAGMLSGVVINSTLPIYAVQNNTVFSGASIGGNKFTVLLLRRSIHDNFVSENTSSTKTTVTNSSPVINMENNPIIVEDGAVVSDNFLEVVSSNYYRVPAHIRCRFEEKGGKIIISKTDLGAELGRNADTVLAYTIPEQYIIKIDNRTSASKSVIHEMGHTLDYDCGWSSKTDEFKVIYEEEVNKFKSIWKTDKQNVSNIKEYFAEAFMVYVLDEELLSSNCPQTYSYIKNASDSRLSLVQ